MRLTQNGSGPRAEKRTDLLPPPLGSPSDTQLLTLLREHIAAEHQVIEDYRRLADDAPEDVGYLMRLIIADEEHHHELLQAMTNSVRERIEFRRADPTVPLTTVAGDALRPLVEATERFLRIERDDLRGLKVLRRLLRRQRDGSHLALLVRQMEFDTRKHIAVLKAIRASARKSPAAV